jgi:anthranilate synthase component I
MTITTSKKTTQFTLRTVEKRQLADTVTPVSLYLKLREHYKHPVLLESTDFRSRENCFSFIGLDTIASFSATQDQVTRHFPDGKEWLATVPLENVANEFYAFIRSFKIENEGDAPVFNGFFGHTCFDAVQYFDTIRFDQSKRKLNIPDLHYALYRYIIAINHFKDELYIVENIPQGEKSKIGSLEKLIKNMGYDAPKPFKAEGAEMSNWTDEQFKNLVSIGKHHCHVGDVFQIVLSRQFSQRFSGDDFNVYRALRTVNPSPYLFYFDCGNYTIFGSSPESQISIKKGIAEISPIAGTYRRTGNDADDRLKAEALSKDPKEVAEHIMLVDLARNDLSRHARNVRVTELKEIQYFSHVIHLVSKVRGDLESNADSLKIFGDTFPAGTLSGAPKYRAMQLIDEYEDRNRAFYGGAIGFIGFDGDMAQAIIIRSFLSQDSVLYCQAGAGVVDASNEESELQEVNNKLAALKRALLEAEKV